MHVLLSLKCFPQKGIYSENNELNSQFKLKKIINKKTKKKSKVVFKDI